MALPKGQREIGIVVEAMITFANDLPNRADDPLKIGPGALLSLLLQRGLCRPIWDGGSHVSGPMASRFAGLLAHAEGELVRRGVHAISLSRGAVPGLDYREEGLRPNYLRVWRDERVVTDIMNPTTKAPPKNPTRRKRVGVNRGPRTRRQASP